MKLTFIWAFIGLILFIASCSTPESENEALKKEVIAIHDEVMPKIGELKSLQNAFLKRASYLEKENREANAEKIEELRNVARQLENAYDDMFIWMRQFKIENGDMDEDKITTYLKEQKIKVEKVNIDIKGALEKAEGLKEELSL